MSKIVQKIKTIVKEISCLNIPDLNASLIIETDASELGWQVILSYFDFTIEHIKGESNALPDFLMREFLQGRNEQEIRSIELTHNKCLTTKDITYSKIKIMKVITLSEWERPPFYYKNFTKKFEPQHYSYYDYIDTWWNTRYLSPNLHSWFLWFCKEISLQFPKWFQVWFQEFGPIEAIFSKKS
ncbi:hypothetical protein AHAS_Ahas11G0228000 [Arachis hypogaea]